MKCKLILLVTAACLLPTLLLAQTEFSPTNSDPNAVNTQDDVSDVNLRPTVIIERALQSYLLSYEAFRISRKSKNKEVRAKIPEFLRNYRVAYANFISILHEDNLYKPQEPPNPAGKYDKKKKKETGYGMLWPKLKIKPLRKKIKKLVSKGATPEDIIAEINASLPSTSIAQPDIPHTSISGDSGDSGGSSGSSDSSDSSGPSESNGPGDSSKPSGSNGLSKSSGPSESNGPGDSSKPNGSNGLSKSNGPGDSSKPSGSNGPSDSHGPSDSSKPSGAPGARGLGN